MELKEVLEFLFDPTRSGSFLTGAFFGFAAGYGIAHWYTHRFTKLLEAENKRVREEIEKVTKKADEQVDQLTRKNSEWEYEHSNQQAEIEYLRSQVRTIRCGICGNGLTRVREYKNPQDIFQTINVLLECGKCGQDVSFTKDEIKDITIQLNGAKTRTVPNIR